MKSFLAALMMFTRIPLWRIIQIDKHYYRNILLYWPLVGFITGLSTWGILCISETFLPLFPACILAIITRLILTGALHEDGLADFCDGFGGGYTKEKILSIMKDSFIGSYGTIGLITYFLMYLSFLYSIPLKFQAATILGADIGSKLVTTFMINTLTYARDEETSKTKILYKHFKIWQFILITIICVSFLIYLQTPLIAFIPTIIIAWGLRMYFKHKIKGYTGDCCGACALISELTFYCGCLIKYYHFQL